MRDAPPNTLRTVRADFGPTPTPGISKLIKHVDDRQGQAQYAADSIARADRTVETAVEKADECVGAASFRMEGTTADLARTLGSADVRYDGLPHGEAQVLAGVYRAISEILFVTDSTATELRAISARVDSARLLIDDGPAPTAVAPDVPSPTGGLSKGVDELVRKSLTLGDLVAEFRRGGGSLGYHETDGPGSEVKTNKLGNPVLLLAKESSKSPEATVREIAWQLGLSGVLPDDVAQNAKPGVSQTALAALIGSRVRWELLGAGENDIGLAHPNGQRYLDIYEQNPSDPRATYLSLYQEALADYERAVGRDAWHAEIVPNLGNPGN